MNQKSSSKPSSLFNKKTQTLVAAISLALSSTVLSAEFNVTEAFDDGTGLVANTLSWAILQANTAAGDDVITLNTDVIITGVMKRLIDSNTTLKSDSTRRSIDGNNSFRPLFIKSGSVLVEDIDLDNGLAKGGEAGGGSGAGMGGSVFIYDGNVRLSSIDFNNSTAENGDATSAIGDGGGGMFGSSNNGGGGLFASSSNSTGAYGGYGNYNQSNQNFGKGGDREASGTAGFGGGGGYGYYNNGGHGGFGGGGGYGYYANGGNGGFGAGGGNSSYYTRGAPGYGATLRFPAAMGGGLFVRSGNVTLNNVTFENNQANATNGAKGLGGGLFILHDTVNSNGNNQGMPSTLATVSGCGLTFTNNSATGDDGVPNNNNDVFDIADLLIQGSCEADINVLGNNSSIEDGDNSPELNDETDFGSEFINSGTIVKIYTIENIGVYSLNLSGMPLVTLTGPDMAEFSVTSQPSVTTLAGAESTTFEVTFTPTSIGVKSATINIESDDTDEASYDFAIQGTGQGPEIDILGNGFAIADGDVTPDISDGTDMGPTTSSSTFVIENNGVSDLTLTAMPNISITGVDSSEFSVTQQPSNSLLTPSTSTTFEVSFNPTSLGVKTATINIENDDIDEDMYSFDIHGGFVINPEIDVLGNGQEIIDGDTEASSIDGTDFGPVTNTRAFTIENNGVSDLALTGIPNVTITGANPVDFIVSTQPSISVISPSSFTTFEISYNPTSPGIKTAIVNIESDDVDESLYDFVIQGGEPVPDIELKIEGITYNNGDSFSPIQWQSTPVNENQVNDLTFTISNHGDSDLFIYSLNDYGNQSYNFDFINYINSNYIEVGSSSDFSIRFDPNDSGIRTSSLVLESDDPDEPLIIVDMFGLGIPVANLQSNTNSVHEGDYLSYSVELNSDAIADTVIEYSIGGEVDNADFVDNMVSGQVTIPLGDYQTEISLETTLDAIYEGTELAVVSINSSDPNVYLGSSTIQIGQIDDNIIYKNGFESFSVFQLIQSIPKAMDGETEKPIFNKGMNSIVFFDQGFLITDDNKSLQRFHQLLEQELKYNRPEGDWDNDNIVNGLDETPFGLERPNNKKGQEE